MARRARDSKNVLQRRTMHHDESSSTTVSNNNSQQQWEYALAPDGKITVPSHLTIMSSDGKKASSSVLDEDTINSRGNGTDGTKDQVSDEIQGFLNDPLSFKKEIRSFLTILIFLTKIPAPYWIDLHPGFLMKGVCYFPVIGSLVGALAGLFFDFVMVSLDLPASVAAVCSTAATFWLTGCFHEDGLADTADGFGGGWTREQIFRIMSDSRLGTFGCSVLLLYTIFKLELISSLGRSHWDLYALECETEKGHPGFCGSRGAGPALLVAHTLARLTAPHLIHCCDYVDDESGPKSSFYSFMVQAKYLVSRGRVFFAFLFSSLVTTALYGTKTALILVLAPVLVAHISGRYGTRVLGGVMGDYLGATICVCEVIVLVLILARDTSGSFLYAYEYPTFEFDPLRERMFEIVGSAQVLAFLRLLVAVIIYRIWRFWVGNTVFELDPKPAPSEGAKPTSKQREEREAASPRDSAELILSTSDSSFVDRYEAARKYIDVLAKPVGSLGTLEDWAARLSALQRTTRPDVQDIACLIFAADHGVALSSEKGGEGCSLYPQAVTRSVLIGLERGVAGASVLAKSNDIHLRVIDVGVVGDAFQGNGVVSAAKKLVNGTKNFCTGPAMSAEESERCILIGRSSLVQVLEETTSKAVVLGEVGIGNTTTSSALIAVLTGQPAETVCGGGAFAARETDNAAIKNKVAIVNKALAKHRGISQAADALSKLGGAEIAALVGAMLEASERDIPVLVDGFIVTAAALVAVSISPYVCHVLFLTSISAEKGQRAAVEKIQSIAAANCVPIPDPALSMSLRMGEATAGLLAVPLLRSSCAILSDMATIQEILSA